MDTHSIQQLFRQLRRQLKDLPCSPDPREIHRLRGRIRQVQVILANSPEISGKWVESLAAVRKAAGRVRDLDVFLENLQTLPQSSGSNSLTQLQSRLRKSRKRSIRSLEKALDRHRKPTRKALSGLARQVQITSTHSTSSTGQSNSRILASKAHQNITRLRKEIAQWPEPDDENLHSLRKNVKTLRTLLQLMPDHDADEIKILGTAAAHMGQWHDWQRLASLACKRLDSSIDSALLRQIEFNEDLHLERALEAAHALRLAHPRPVKATSDVIPFANRHRVA
ncbi:MAG: CHAD domain-containing protein [Acidobacteriota bacterium]|nr:CHAD domain-containing protein [Acidobacteriota bacterium]